MPWLDNRFRRAIKRAACWLPGSKRNFLKGKVAFFLSGSESETFEEFLFGPRFFLGVPCFYFFVIRVFFFLFPGTQGFDFSEGLIAVQFVGAFDGVADAQQLNFALFAKFDIEGIAATGDGTVLINGAEVVFAEILAPFFGTAQSHNAEADFELDPSGLIFAPGDFTGFVEVDDLGGFLTGSMDDASDVFVGNQYDGFSTAIATAGTSEVE